MGKVYKGQSKLRIRLTTNQNISGATPYIKYKKPSGVVGTRAAQVENTPSGIIYYDLTTATLLNESGAWKFWAYVSFSGGLIAPGKAAVVNVYDEGD